MAPRADLIYLPLERYSNRYTEYLSGSTGMFARGCASAGVQVHTIAPSHALTSVKDGVVVDYVRRSRFSFSQITELVAQIRDGVITDNSIIYFEDFWTGGMEMLPYACTLAGIRPKVYAFCHAQSVDPNDFTVSMLPWIRHFEIGWAEWLTGIFVADKALKDMLLRGGVCPAEKIHATGTVFDRSYIVENYYGGASTPQKRKPCVFYTSRFDPEKNPGFFYRLAHHGRDRRSDVCFMVLSGRRVPTAFHNDNDVTVYENASKHAYFELLAKGAVMVNCGVQDFVGYCQLDALAMGCSVLCPRHLTFPGLLHNNESYLYTPGDVEEAWEKLNRLLDVQANAYELGFGDEPELWTQFGAKYEKSVERMLGVMYA
jgi:hypothetical protein